MAQPTTPPKELIRASKKTAAQIKKHLAYKALSEALDTGKANQFALLTQVGIGEKEMACPKWDKCDNPFCRKFHPKNDFVVFCKMLVMAIFCPYCASNQVCPHGKDCYLIHPDDSSQVVYLKRICVEQRHQIQSLKKTITRLQPIKSPPNN
jgi:hypothetical protein